ncbi:hypothetical protein [Achromobacter insolitus]|uniref:hypothetical protein n=1 Tax=Achromobacter insolitus TaxID=217204 RepID=UPI000AE157BB|nr:hypothetical protein [Achromobacter insolitus]AVG38330.1 hypothetical protein MC81_02475 [Achromobacter insolitus]
MRERPILFSAPMVRAILAGNKTQTRRVAKEFAGRDDLDAILTRFPNQSGCPYGQPGDRLWVRESFWGCDAPGWGDQPCVVYDDEWHGKEYRPAEVRPWARKFGRIPSIHMPRDCSRITLEITGVRVERLQAITLDDLCEEGISELLEDPHSVPGRAFSRAEHAAIGGVPMKHIPEKYGFAALWDSLNGSGAWDANPWVWVVDFRVVPHPKQHNDGGAVYD